MADDRGKGERGNVVELSLPTAKRKHVRNTIGLRKGANQKRARSEAARESGAFDQPTRWQQLLAGSLTIRELDNEELKRGQTRDRIGEFGGGSPAWPRKLEQARTNELLRRGQDIATSSVPLVMKALEDIVFGKDPFASTADRIRAATIMIERGAGKVADHVVHHSATPWDDILEGVIFEETGERAPQRT